MLALQNVFKPLDWEDKGVNINGEWLNNLWYADNIVVVAESFEDFQTMLTELEGESKRWD